MITLILSLLGGLNLDQVQWENLLNANFIYDIAPDFDGAWCATNGGVRYFSLNDSAFTYAYTTVDGLPHNNCRALYQLVSGELWVGTDKGLVFLDHQSGNVKRSSVVGVGDSVFSIIANGDTLLVGTQGGTYMIQMGNTPSNIEDDYILLFLPWEGRRICWFDESIWIGSNNSLRQYSPFSGETVVFSESDGLSSTDIRDFDCRNQLNVLIPEGVYRFDTFTNSFNEVFSLPDPDQNPTSLLVKGDTIYVSTSSSSGIDKLKRYIESEGLLDSLRLRIDVPEGEDNQWARHLQVLSPDSDGHVWIGLGGSDYWGEGLIVWDGQWITVWDGSQSFDCPGLNSNYIHHLSLDDRDYLWASHWKSYNERGVTGYSPDGWKNFISLDDSIDFSLATKVSRSDSRGRVIFGTWGFSKGLTRYDPAIEEWNAHKWGESSSVNICAFMSVDPLDRIWYSVFYIDEMRVLSENLVEIAAISWPYGNVWDIRFDSNTVWTATTDGLVAYKSSNFTGHPESGEFSVKVNTTSEVMGICLDGSGGVWGVTNQGAFHWTEEETVWFTESNSPLPENDLVSIDRDCWGRVYFLCRNSGVVVYDPAGNAYDSTSLLWQMISAENSSLIPGYPYTWLDVDKTGRLGVGTGGGGISLLELPPPAEIPSVSVSVYPNPCYISQGLPVRFVPVDGVESMSIYTISGENVAEIDSADFVNLHGTLHAEFEVANLSSGLYLAVLRYPDRIERIKFVLLR